MRNYLFNAWKKVAHRYGFLEWEGPTVEATELYLKKSGGELPTQLFRFTDQGDRDITIRPELTASLGRIAAAYQREYTKPLKWFEIGSCFRYEKPQKGRLREFYQFNADILGEASAWADSELIALAIDCMRELGFTQNDFIVRVSDREAWIRFASEHGVQEQDIPAFLGIVDKFERDRPEECQRKLDAFHISRGDLVAFIENPPAGASERYDILMKDLTARGLDGYVKLDLSVVRGLAYYTGLVFEIFDTQRSLRAVAGGGRYDTLVGALSNNAVDMPATGFAMGDAVITHLIEQTPHARALKDAALAYAGCDIFMVQASESRRAEVLAIASALREEFPKANKGMVSMALHTNNYGVKFCARAQEIYDAVTQQKPRRPRRVKPIRLQCRLTESTAQRVKQALERNGIASMQTFLETLVLAWLEQSESAAGGDDTDSAYRKNNLASNSTAKEAGLSSVPNVPLP